MTMISKRSFWSFSLAPRLLAWVFFLSPILSCSASGPSREEGSRLDEIARGTAFPKLYYIENDWMVAVRCPSGTILFDHANCNGDRRSVPAALFYQNLYARWGGQAAAIELRMSQYYVRITQIHTKMLEFIDDNPTDPGHGELLVQIQDKVVDLAAVDVVIAELADQEARIVEALRLGANDANLRQQLTLVRESLAPKKTAAEGIRREIELLRKLYTEENSALIDATTYRDLVSQRDAVVVRLESERNTYRYELEKSVATSRALKRLEDHFAYDYTSDSDVLNPGTNVVVSFFEQTFNESEAEYAKVIFAPTDRPLRFAVTTTNVGVLESVDCRFTVQTGVRCQGIEITTPEFRVYNEGLSFQISTNCSNCGTVETRSILRKPVAGAWRAELVCSTIGVGGNFPVTSANCSFSTTW